MKQTKLLVIFLLFIISCNRTQSELVIPIVTIEVETKLITISEDWQELETWLVANYQTVTDKNLLETLYSSGWRDSINDGVIIRKDIDKDGIKELIITLVEMSNVEGKPRQELWILNQQGVQYKQEILTATLMKVNVDEDVTGDGLSDIIVEENYINFGYSIGLMSVISSQSGAYVNIVVDEDNKPSLIHTLFKSANQYDDFNHDGVVDIKFSRGGASFGNIASGEVRQTVEIWSYDNDLIAVKQLDSFLIQPVVFRQHAVYEANNFMQEEAFDKAISLYEQVIEDVELQDWSFKKEASMGDEYYDVTKFQAKQGMQVFAGLKLILLSTLTEDSEGVERWFSWLVEIYPDHAVTQMADNMIILWKDGADPSFACQTSLSFLKSDNDAMIGIEWLGDSNPKILPVDFCH